MRIESDPPLTRLVQRSFILQLARVGRAAFNHCFTPLPARLRRGQSTPSLVVFLLHSSPMLAQGREGSLYRSRTPSHCRFATQAQVHLLEQVGILQRCRDALLIVEQFIDRGLGGVRPA